MSPLIDDRQTAGLGGRTPSGFCRGSAHREVELNSWPFKCGVTSLQRRSEEGVGEYRGGT